MKKSAKYLLQNPLNSEKKEKSLRTIHRYRVLDETAGNANIGKRNSKKTSSVAILQPRAATSADKFFNLLDEKTFPFSFIENKL